MTVPKDPWTDPDPQPGDFDGDLEAIDPRYVEVHEGNPDAKFSIVVDVEDEDAKRLQERSAARGQPQSEVISSPLRQA
jgi:hypothetical protein